MILGFSGYLVFVSFQFSQLATCYQLVVSEGLIIGLAYDKITTIIPLFVVL